MMIWTAWLTVAVNLVDFHPEIPAFIPADASHWLCWQIPSAKVSTLHARMADVLKIGSLWH